MKRMAFLAALLLLAAVPAQAQVTPNAVIVSDPTTPSRSVAVNSDGSINVNATVGTGATFGATFPATGTAIGAKNSGSMQPLNVDGSGNLNVGVNVALPAGTAILGKVGIDQTTPGTTNAVALTAGTAIAGKFGIDQTTPGTTNGVQVNAALPAGSNLIGVVGNAQGSATSGQSGPLAQCAVTSSAPSYTTAQTNPLSCDTSGALRTSSSASNASVSTTGAAVPASATYMGISIGGNLTGPLGGAGTEAGALRVTLPTDGTGKVGLNAGTALIGNVGSATGSAVPAGAVYLGASSGGTLTGLLIGAGTEAGALRVTLPTDGTGKVGLIAGTALVGKVGLDQTTPGTTNAVSLAQIGATTVSTGNGVAGAGVQRVTVASDNTAFSVNAVQSGSWTAQPVAAATGGATPYYLSGGSAASTNSTNIKASAGTLYTLTVVSTSATLAYLRMYDSASAPTCSSATGAVHSYPIPASTTGAGLTITFPVGELYASGIGYCLTGGGTSTDNTNATTGIYINASYK